MKARWERMLEVVRTGFWFVPLLMLGLACALALWLLRLDGRVDPGIKSSLAWAYTGGPEGARSLLSTVAGSMITAASVTFSLASVALSIASQQYGSRVLRNFMRDRVTQVLLGTFVSTFVYSVLVVRAIRGSDVQGGFVPAISVTVAIVLSVVSLVLLILFIHHVSTSIQAAHIVQVIADDLHETIPKLYPSETGEGAEELSVEELRNGPSVELVLAKSGYLQTLDLDSLMRVATEQGVLVDLKIRPGDHAVDGAGVATVWGRESVDESALEAMRDAFFFGGQRTAAQDVRFQFQQLTDVVVRALSPGINDPFTAVNGIDQLASSLVLLAKRDKVRRLRADGRGVPRLYVPAPTVREVLEETVGHIMIYGAGDRFVMQSLFRTVDAVAPLVEGETDQRAVARVRQEMETRERSKLKESSGVEE